MRECGSPENCFGKKLRHCCAGGAGLCDGGAGPDSPAPPVRRHNHHVGARPLHLPLRLQAGWRRSGFESFTVSGSRNFRVSILMSFLTYSLDRLGTTWKRFQINLFGNRKPVLFSKVSESATTLLSGPWSSHCLLEQESLLSRCPEFFPPSTLFC